MSSSSGYFFPLRFHPVEVKLACKLSQSGKDFAVDGRIWRTETDLCFVVTSLCCGVECRQLIREGWYVEFSGDIDKERFDGI